MEKPPFVLIVEDVREIAENYADILGYHGLGSEIITDGAVAMARLAAFVPDLILLDMHLPNVSGMDILTYVRGDARFSKTKVIVITANARLAEDLGDKADLTLLKPVRLEQISEFSERLLQSRA